MKKFDIKKGISVTLAGILIVTALPISSIAAEKNTEKEEVIYVNLKENGNVDEINVVNIFNPEGNGQITDYGDYQSTRNMTTTDALNYSNGTVSIKTDAGKLYYEGKLNDNTIPWKIGIRYELNGEEYSLENLAGKDGKIKIVISIKENPSCTGDFYDKYALQTSLSLDTERFTNIEAPDATMANVGKDKQLTYTILPGKGADIEITADVTDFQMEDGIAINGIPLNLNVEVDDAELMDQVTELLDAIEKIDDGTGELSEGVEELKDGAEGELKSGAKSLDQGAGQLEEGAGDLKKGGTTVNSGAKSLEEGAKSLDDGIKTLNQGITQVQSGLDSLNKESGTLTGGSSQMKKALEELQTALNGVSASADDLTKLTEASSAIQEGID